MNKVIPHKILDDFCDFFETHTWLQGVPGGFCTNSPKRLVTAFGDGGYDTTHWTAKVSASSVTLHTKPNKMPDQFSAMIPYLKTVFKDTFPSAVFTDSTFSIAICNYYTEPDMYIAAHTDDNVWYPRECDQGPVFASLTLYPKGEPKQLARFQIKKDDTWEQVNLPHRSLMIMPSHIMHRVQPYKKRDIPFFKPRINITFRSTYQKTDNPLLHKLAISNHARYYSVPNSITFPTKFNEQTKKEIIDCYRQFCQKYNQKFIVQTRDRDRSSLIKVYRQKGYMMPRISNNMVAETFENL